MKPSTTPGHAPSNKSGIKGPTGALMMTMAALLMASCSKPAHFAEHNDGKASVGHLVEGAESTRAVLEGMVRASELPRLGGEPLNVQSFKNVHDYLVANFKDGMTIRHEVGNGEYIDFAFTVNKGNFIFTYSAPNLTVNGKRKSIAGTVQFNHVPSKNGKTPDTVTFDDGTGPKEITQADFQAALKQHLGVK